MKRGTGWAARKDRFALARRMRRETRALARTEEHLLRPGLYLRAGESVWRHWRAHLPLHLRQSKIGKRAYTPRTAVAKAIQQIVPPLAFRVRQDLGGSFSIAVSADDGGLVLLAPEKGLVARTYGSGQGDGAYIDLRRRYEKYVATPRFEVTAGSRLIIEEFVHGQHFLELGPDARLSVVRHLFRRYALLSKHEGEGDSANRVRTALAAVSQGHPPAEIAACLATPLLEVWSRAWPLVPSATDANVKNLIVRPDQTPVIIDLGNLRLDPVFYYPVGVVVLAREHVLDRFLAGDLDQELHALFPENMAQHEFDQESRRSLLALRIAILSYRRATAAGAFDQALFDDTLTRRWSALWSGEPATYTGALLPERRRRKSSNR